MEKATKIQLTKPPLAEAIFEIRWKNSLIDQKLQKNSQLIAGMLYEKIKDEYGFFEPQPASAFPLPPDETFSNVPLYRFRVGENKWPVIQLGAGVLSVHDTNQYEWVDFKARCLKIVDTFLQMYPIGDAVEGMSLRYVNSLDFDYKTNDVLAFLGEEMGVNISFPTSVFEVLKIEKKPENFNSRFSFPATEPLGIFNFAVASGKIKENDAVIWDASFLGKKEGLPKDMDELNNWLESAHDKLEQWFFTLIKKIAEKFN